MSSLAFDNAIVRTPARSVVDGLRAVDVGAPSFDGVMAEHAAYVRALEAAGVAVEALPALEAFPDSVFVEDAALVFGAGAIVLRPGAPSRRGEIAEIAPVLERRFARVLRLGEGTADGGDVLATPRGVFIGLSARTDAAGAAGLTHLLAELGFAARVVTTPPGVLHFKSDCALLDEETVLATPALAGSGVFEGFSVLVTPAGEEPAANAVRVNDRLLISDAFPRTAAMLDGAGYTLTPLATREIAKIDAGLSCMSLRWQA
jgi:dimethylargininase